MVVFIVGGVEPQLKLNGSTWCTPVKLYFHLGGRSSAFLQALWTDTFTLTKCMILFNAPVPGCIHLGLKLLLPGVY